MKKTRLYVIILNSPKLSTPPLTKKKKIHIFDTFLLEESRNTIEFNIDQSSAIRVFAKTKVACSISLEKTNNSELVFSSSSGELAIDWLIDGQYRLKLSYDSYDMFRTNAFCPIVELQLEIMPTNELSQLNLGYSCPSGSINVLPSIPSQIISLPYYLHNTNTTTTRSKPPPEDVYYAFSTFGSTVISFTFTVFDNVLLEAGIGSSFLASNLRLSLSSGTSYEDFSVTRWANFNYLKKELIRGTYTLSIVRTSPLSYCTPFSFDFSVIPITTFLSQRDRKSVV